MEKRKFAKSDEEISLLGYGCWGIGKTMWIGADDMESKKALHRAVDEGINFFDTALVYGMGHSESLVGEVEKESGMELFVASKVPPENMEWPADENTKLKDAFSKNHIIKRTEQSLINMKRDHIDLMQFHVWNDKWANEDEWKEAVTKLKKEGKVKYWGISINDHQPENGIETGKTGLIDSYQVIFNIFDQKPVEQLFPFCKKNKISIIARVPFDEGALTGNIGPHTDFPSGDFRNNYFRGNRKMEVKIRADNIWHDVKTEVDSLAEAALRYIISFDAVTSVIPGMRKEKNLVANIASVNKGSLPNEMLKELKVHKWYRNFYE
ncbi:MAG TPA: aldo/keto reductase [Ignavibacteriaceae bacterium]|nr:aldo/keto reductase [Ignavibacteriaceae bacterium]